jgi:hypothetical protein
VHAIKVQGGSGGIIPLSLNIGNIQRRVVSFTSRSLYRGRMSPWYPLNRRLAGTQNWSGERCTKVLSAPGIEFGHPVRSLDAVSTELSQLETSQSIHYFPTLRSTESEDPRFLIFPFILKHERSLFLCLISQQCQLLRHIVGDRRMSTEY